VSVEKEKERSKKYIIFVGLHLKIGQIAAKI
jgi:hypothetical protein